VTNASERLNATLLIIRLALFAAAAAFASEISIPPFVILAVGTIFITVVGVRRDPRLLPYGFLFATALWGGVATALMFAGEGPVPSTLALMLAIMDGSRFVLLRCRQ
jgi:hypothetical protein